MSRKSGYFICYRNIWQHPVFKNLLQASAWIYMISSASHQDKELRFLDNKIFVRRGELIFPLRVNAKRFKMSYSEMRTFILRLVRRGMITTRHAHLQPTANHKNRKVTLINVVNYDKFQQYDLTPNQYKTTTNALLNNKLNNNTNISKDKKNVNSGNYYDGSYKVVSTWGDEDIVEKNGKKYVRHRWKGTIKPLEK